MFPCEKDPNQNPTRDAAVILFSFLHLYNELATWRYLKKRKLKSSFPILILMN